MQTHPLLRYCFVLFDGFSNMVFASAVEPLRAARDLCHDRRISWEITSVSGKAVSSSSGIRIQPDGALAKANEYDVLILICGYGARAWSEQAVLSDISLASRRASLVIGLDAGAWLMAAANLLDGYKATIHWQEMEAFEETFLNVALQNERYVIDRDRMTAGGATTVMDLMLQVIREQLGEAIAFDVSNLFVYDAENRTRDGRGARHHSITARVPQLEKAIHEMMNTIEEPRAIDHIAEKAAVSPRTLERLFHRELGIAPGRYYQMVRLNRARALAEETNFTVAEIAARTGFASVSTLSRAFSRHFRQTIRSMRKGRLRQIEPKQG